MADDYTETLEELKALLAADPTGDTLRVQRNRRRRRFVAAAVGKRRSARLSAIISVLPAYVPPI